MICSQKPVVKKQKNMLLCPHSHHEKVSKADEMCPICTYAEIAQLKERLLEVQTALNEICSRKH